MFASIRKHQKWLWLLIILLVIISFVIFFSPDVRFGDMGLKDNWGSINGREIDQEEFRNAYKEGQLGYFFRFSQWPDRSSEQFGYDPEQEAYSRIFLIDQLKQHNIQVTDDAVTEWVIQFFRDPQTGQMQKEIYDLFLNQILPQQRLTKNDFFRYARHEAGIRHLVNLVGLPGRLVAPEEARWI